MRLDSKQLLMSTQEQLSELEKLAQGLEVSVSYDAMTGIVQGIGGLCKVKGKYRIIIDRRLKPPERLQILIDSLRRFDIEGLQVSKSVRRLLN